MSNDLMLPQALPAKHLDARVRWLTKAMAVWLSEEVRRNMLGLTSAKLSVLTPLLNEYHALIADEKAFDDAGRMLLEAIKK